MYLFRLRLLFAAILPLFESRHLALPFCHVCWEAVGVMPATTGNLQNKRTMVAKERRANKTILGLVLPYIHGLILDYFHVLKICSNGATVRI